MVEISMSGSGEGLGWATGPGYSTMCAGHGAQRHGWRCQTVSESDP